MKCPFCNREIKAEKNNQWESWGILVKEICPKCNMVIKTELKPFQSQRKFCSIKEIIEEFSEKWKKSKFW
jgi:hypothetical protein